jgi:hypothetical protein
MDEIIKGRVAIAVNETIHQHQARYSEELVQKLEDLKRAYATTYSETTVGVLFHQAQEIGYQVQVLEARMDTLRDLEEDMQKALEGVNYASGEGKQRDIDISKIDD